MNIPLIPLLVPHTAIPSVGTLIEKEQHKKAQNAYAYTYEIEEGNVILTEPSSVSLGKLC